MRHLAVAPDRYLHPRRQRVGHRHPNPVQAAGKTVGATLQLVELAAGVQAGEHQFDHRRVLLGMQAEGNATPVVFHAHTAVGVQGDGDALAITAQGFVGAVVYDFLDDMQRGVGAGVHARTLAHRLQPLEHADGRFGISGSAAGGHRIGEGDGRNETIHRVGGRSKVIPIAWGKFCIGRPGTPDFTRIDRHA
ncbi:hypothetical protein GALL_518130 [mine drainage metagenome]|uniref:Uncharacterized protein n=1 Tax=mine drainage metagenome TaxID=410659 RepID=A0A1J5P775_9ZZZZ